VFLQERVIAPLGPDALAKLADTVGSLALARGDGGFLVSSSVIEDKRLAAVVEVSSPGTCRMSHQIGGIGRCIMQMIDFVA